MSLEEGITIAGPSLDHVMPMHAVVDAAGVIVHIGPTLDKVCGRDAMVGQRFFDAFEILRPARAEGLQDLVVQRSSEIRLRPLRRGTQMKAAVVPLSGGGHLVNLSFAIWFVEAVGENDLTAADFAPTDLAIEMLYLYEAKTAAMEVSRGLIERLHQSAKAAEARAYSDALTGLSNLRGFEAELARRVERAAPFALMNVDLDFFKTVNDTLGHAAGDHVLREVAEILQENCRETDIVARIGGDEFVILFEGPIESDHLTLIADRLIDAIERPIRFGDETCRISASIGTAASTTYEAVDSARIRADADEALYASKHAGRGRNTIYSAPPPETGERRRATIIGPSRGPSDADATGLP